MATGPPLAYNLDRMSRRRFHFLFWSLVSVGIHFLYFVGLEYFPVDWLQQQQRNQNQAVEVDLVSPSTKEDQQFVRQTQTDESQLVESKEKARFKSEKDQRVLLETRAQNVGISKNRQQEPRFLKQAREEKQRQETPQQQEQRKIKLSQTGIDYSQFKALDVKKELRQPEYGPSTVGEALPKDVSIGSFTALNTDRFTFYTFYARIEELVRFRWETKVKEAVDSFSRNFIVSQEIGRAHV